MKRSREDLHPYQVKAINFLLSSPGSAALFLDMGLGKTIITLTTILDMLCAFSVSRVLVVGPLRVVRNVWENETGKWEHLHDLTFSRILGDEKTRLEGIAKNADIYLVNYEQYKWLIEHHIGEPGKRKKKKGKPVPFPYDLIIFDELTKLKHVSSQRYRAHKRIAGQRSMKYWGLTGSPTARHLLDIFGQYYVLDGGKRLGTNFGQFKRTYFNQMDYQGYQWEPKKKAKKNILKKVGDMTLRMDAKDYLDMPSLITNDIELHLPSNTLDKYTVLRKEMFIELESGAVEAQTAAALSMKCHQFANGAVYVDGDPDRWEEVHKTKLEAFDDIIEEANGRPILGITNFRHDAARLQAKYKCPKFGSGTTAKEEEKILKQWANKEIPLLIGYPGSMGHGLDGLQDTGEIVAFFSLGWNREFYDQTIARLWRQGQKQTVIVHRLVMLGTVDESIRESLTLKDANQKQLLAILKKQQK